MSQRKHYRLPENPGRDFKRQLLLALERAHPSSRLDFVFPAIQHSAAANAPATYESALTNALRAFYVGAEVERLVDPIGYRRRERFWRYRLVRGAVEALVSVSPEMYVRAAGEKLEDLGVVCDGVWILSTRDHDREGFLWLTARGGEQLAGPLGLRPF